MFSLCLPLPSSFPRVLPPSHLQIHGLVTLRPHGRSPPPPRASCSPPHVPPHCSPRQQAASWPQQRPAATAAACRGRVGAAHVPEQSMELYVAAAPCPRRSVRVASVSPCPEHGERERERERGRGGGAEGEAQRRGRRGACVGRAEAPPRRSLWRRRLLVGRASSAVRPRDRRPPAWRVTPRLLGHGFYLRLRGA